MSRPVWDRLRQIAPDRGRVIAFAILFLSFEASIRYLESINIPISARLPLRPASALSFLAAIAYGIARVTGFHPAFQKDYRAWLEFTPWNNRKPLPLGPVDLVIEDALVLGPLLLCNAILPQPRAMSVLCAFLLAHLGALVVSLWLTGIRLVGYLAAFGLGFAVKLWHQPIECLAMGALVYLIAYEGLVQSLNRFPWTSQLLPRASRPSSILHTDLTTLSGQRDQCGWPYDRMLGDVQSKEGIPRLDAVLCCALATWWLYVLASFVPDERARLGVVCMVCQFPYVMFPFARIAIYTKGYLPPISLLGRIRTLQLIIPGFDQVFVTPLCAGLAGPAVFALAFVARVPIDACVAIATGASAAVTLVGPPRLLHWRLTGQHRMVSGITAANHAFIKVG
jgi:hypothetical protein